MPPDIASEEEEGDFGPPYPHDVGRWLLLETKSNGSFGALYTGAS